MNKQELIKQIKKLFVFGVKDYIEREEVLKLVEQLDEPQKVKIPHIIAEYIEQKKDDDYHLLGAMIEIRSHKNKEIYEWFWDYDDNMELFARAWLDGYEVEEKKRYTVVMKETKQPLYYNAVDKKLFFSTGGIATNFTRKQLEEAGLGWVFDCEGVEVREVE